MQQRHQPQVDFQEGSGPNWSGVRTLAAGQAGHFTAAQAKAYGFSEQLLSKHVAAGNLERPQRGIYRRADFPATDHEDLVVAWLWSGEEAVVSHESALQTHALSDALPARIHITLPAKEEGRRRVVPPAYILHYANVPTAERVWVGPVPVTIPARTVRDVAEAHGDANLVHQAIDEGTKRRRLFTVWDVAPAVEYAQSIDTWGWRVFPKAIEDLGDSFVVHALSGICVKAPPSDWPTLARQVIKAHGGRLYVQAYHPRSGTMHTHVAWAQPGPGGRALDALRADLTRTFRWR